MYVCELPVCMYVSTVLQFHDLFISQEGDGPAWTTLTKVCLFTGLSAAASAKEGFPAVYHIIFQVHERLSHCMFQVQALPGGRGEAE